MPKTNRPPKPETESAGTRAHQVSSLRRAADVLSVQANQERGRQIRRVGVTRYLEQVLGPAAGHRAAACLLVWPHKIERVAGGVGQTLLEYLVWRARKDHGLPEAVVLADGTKLYI